MASLVLKMCRTTRREHRGDLTEAVTRLLLAQGGARFARSLVKTGLIVSTAWLVIHPVVLGAGERLFTAPLTIEPISTTAFSGAVAHVFAAHR
jgi:riboflavin biosynthesis pyrimidine reductase